MPASENKRTPYDELIESEKRNKKYSNERYAIEIDKYQKIFDLLVEAFNCIIDKINQRVSQPISKREFAILVNCSRIIVSSGAYIELLIKGYYYDAAILRRSIEENVWLITCFIDDEKYADKWLKNTIRLGQVKNKAGISSDETIKKVYSSLSDFVHSNIPAFWTITERGSTSKKTGNVNVTLPVVPIFRENETISQLFLPGPQFEALVFLNIGFKQCFTPELSSKIQDIFGDFIPELIKKADEPTIQKLREKFGKNTDEKSQLIVKLIDLVRDHKNP